MKLKEAGSQGGGGKNLQKLGPLNIDEILGDDNRVKAFGGLDMISKTRETTKQASTKLANNSLGVGRISLVEWTFNNEAGSRSSKGA